MLHFPASSLPFLPFVKCGWPRRSLAKKDRWPPERLWIRWIPPCCPPFKILWGCLAHFIPVAWDEYAQTSTFNFDSHEHRRSSDDAMTQHICSDALPRGRLLGWGTHAPSLCSELYPARGSTALFLIKEALGRHESFQISPS